MLSVQWLKLWETMIVCGKCVEQWMSKIERSLNGLNQYRVFWTSLGVSACFHSSHNFTTECSVSSARINFTSWWEKGLKYVRDDWVTQVKARDTPGILTNWTTESRSPSPPQEHQWSNQPAQPPPRLIKISKHRQNGLRSCCYHILWPLALMVPGISLFASRYFQPCITFCRVSLS